MTSEKELIVKIKELRQIQPSKEWVLSVKNSILDTETSPKGASIWEVLPRMLFQPRMAFAGVFTIFTLLGVITFSQNSLPGDPLYLIKRITEKAQAVFVSRQELPKAQLVLANKRLEELAKIAESNQVKKLAPALQEYQASIAEATRDLVIAAATTSDPAMIKGIAAETQKLEKTRENLEKTYGIAGLEVKEEANPTKVVVEWLIKDLEKRTLTEDQQLLFDGAKEDYSAGNYNPALIKILQLSELSQQ